MRRLLLLVAVLLAVSCGNGEQGPETDEIDSSWSGTW
jgi:hypothetical protein